MDRGKDGQQRAQPKWLWPAMVLLAAALVGPWLVAEAPGQGLPRRPIRRQAARRVATRPEVVRPRLSASVVPRNPPRNALAQAVDTPPAAVLDRSALPSGGPRSPGTSVDTPARADETFEVPLSGSTAEEIFLQEEAGLLSLVVRNGSLHDVLTALAETQGLNIVTAGGLEVPVTVTLDRVRLEDALDAVLSVAGYTWVLNEHNIIHVTSLAGSAGVAPEMQDRRMEVFQLDYATAEDVNTVITSILSPVGTSLPIASSETDNRRTREVLVVEDLPPYLQRIRQQIAMIDVPPRQVLIHVHVLQIDLDEDNRHGVNFDHGFNMTRNLMHVQTLGFANPVASQAFFAHLSGGNLTGLLELLQSTTDSKTLASPKLLCLNGQTARLQVGEQLGFRVTTTTETSTTESVEFLDVGVVLEVTPRISRDGRIMMRISPEVSSGEVSVATGLPEEATTELQTDVLLGDNQGVVIGGLIQELDNNLQAKIPWLGDLHFIGKFFQRKEDRRRRTEIIIALLPKVVPYDPIYQEEVDMQVEQARTPLLYGPLCRYPRPWEPSLPDALDNPTPLPTADDIFRCGRCDGSPCQCPHGKPGFDVPPYSEPLPDDQLTPSAGPLPVHFSRRAPLPLGRLPSVTRRLPPVERRGPRGQTIFR